MLLKRASRLFHCFSVNVCLRHQIHLTHTRFTYFTYKPYQISAMAIETLPESHIDSNGTLGKRPRLEDDTELVRSTSKLLIKRLSDKARLPTRGSKHAAGYDLHSSEQKIVPAKSKALIDTDISVAIPIGCYGRVAPRSGLAWKFMIDTGAGVIDSDYRGPLRVLLFNFSDNDFEIKEGDRIAQLIIEKIEMPEVEDVDDLDSTVRGAGGFGSTGGHNAL